MTKPTLTVDININEESDQISSTVEVSISDHLSEKLTITDTLESVGHLIGVITDQLGEPFKDNIAWLFHVLSGYDKYRQRQWLDQQMEDAE